MTHHTFRFGTTDTHLTPIALGAMLFGTRTPEAEAVRILDHYLTEVTPRFIAPDGTPARGMVDTADCYCWWEVERDAGGHSERVIGRYFADAGNRAAAFLATKGTATIDDLNVVWPTPGGAPDWDVARSHFVGASAEALLKSLPASLDRLGLDSVDLYYVHVDDRRAPLSETLATLAAFVEQGRIGAYGWSNVPAWRLAQIREIAATNGWPQPIALQQEHSYLRKRAGHTNQSIVDTEQLDYLATYPDLQLVAYSPILKGVYADPHRRGDHWALNPYRGPDADARLAAVDSVAATAGATANQVVLAWLLTRTAPRVLPLIGPRTFDQYLECIEALDVTLTPDQVAELDAAGA